MRVVILKVGYPGHLKSQWQRVEHERDAYSPACLTSALSDYGKGLVSIGMAYRGIHCSLYGIHKELSSLHC